MMTTADPRVVAYLQRLEVAAASLRAERRAELVAEIRDHIDTRLRDPGPAVPGMDPVDVALSRLGEPEEIVAAAADEPGAVEAVRESTAPKAGALEGGAIGLLLVGGFLLIVGWFVGVALLWKSQLWSTRDKLIGTLVWPLGLVTPVLVAFVSFGTSVESCSISTDSNGDVSEVCVGGVSPLAIGLGWAFLVAPIAVAIYLGIKAIRPRVGED